MCFARHEKVHSKKGINVHEKKSIILRYFLCLTSYFLYHFFHSTNICCIILKTMDPFEKISHAVDTLFGTGVSKNIPKDIDFKMSKKTGRIRAVYHNGLLLFTPRTDGGIAMSIYCAELFSKNKKFINDYCIEVDADSKPFVEQGKSVFCQHVKRCGSKIEIGSDVPIFFKKQIIAVGKSILSSNMIKTQSRGMAIRVRDSLKSQIDGGQS